jgi:hypothetical protein
MNIKIGKGALSALAVFLALVAGYWYWSPYIAIHQMQSAAKSADADAFNDKVDYPKLRESLKGQFSALVAEKLGSSSDAGNAFSALGNMLGLAMADKMVDAMVRPETVMRAMQNGQFRPGQKAPAADAGSGSQSPAQKEEKPKWSYDRKSVDKLIAFAEDSSKGDDKRVGLVLERSGFANWKLTEIRMPALAQ